MNIAIEKVVAKLGWRIAQKCGPGVLAFLAANPWLIPLLVVGAITVGAIEEQLG